MSPTSTAWSQRKSTVASTMTRVARAVGVAALATTAFLSVGCGVSPAYEPEPRMPGAYTAAPSPGTDPLTSEQLAAQNEANASARGEIAVGDDENEYTDTDPSALTEFKPALEGHGQWVDDPAYGTIWVPAASEVGSDFAPYTTGGHWTYDDTTNYVWVSDYSWGWAPFHYGRWVNASHHGWAWIPGRTYAGAWVVWRSGDAGYGYVGWAPAGPDWYWYNGYAVGWTFGYTPYYSYCHRDYFYNPYVGGHVVRGGDPRGRDIEAHTRPYTPAQPGVGPVGNGNGGPGRVAANPSVGGGRVAASPRVGPSPSELGMRSENVVAPPRGNAGLERAQALAAPRTAVAAGGAAPAQTRRRAFDRDGVAAEPSARISDGRGPATAARIDPAARAPQIAGVTPSGPRPMSRSLSDSPGASPPSAPTYRSAPTMAAAAPSQPSFRSQPSPSQPSASAPAFRSAPSFSSSSQSSPSFRSSTPSSTPAFRAAPTQPTFRSSTPSAPSISRPSSPSVSSPSRSMAPSVARPSSPSRSSTTSGKRR